MGIDSTLNDRESFLINESKILNLQKISIIKNTTPKPLTLTLQDKLARRVGSGMVNFEFKKINLSNKNLRINTLRSISKSQKKIDMELFDIRKTNKNSII